jgi:ATP-dependent Lhr-like helicase
MADLLSGDPTGDEARRWLTDEVGLGETAARELVEYLMSSHAALGTLPTQETIVFERFFDEAGGMQLVIHSPFGSRINRAWGLALRKRFCRKFNFELQAAATEDNIVLSLTTAHSFELGDVARYLNSNTVKPLLIQALLDAPMFTTRWRWVTGISLALPRFRGGKKIAPQLARMAAEDLLATVFPDQVACGENLVGEREIPDHPLVRQTIEDCLCEAMDLAGLERLLTRLERGEIRVVACDLTEPSPLALEVLSARPYAYLDDAPLEERRTQAVMSRRWLAPEVAADLGRLDPEAIARVRGEAWPEPANADELHDALVWLGYLTAEEVTAAGDWNDWLGDLAQQKRAGALHTSAGTLWVTAERLPEFRALWPPATLLPEITAPAPFAARNWSPEEALVEILRGRLEGLGPVTEAALAAPLGRTPSDISAALAALQTEGFAMRGRFTPQAGVEEWCERRLLARIHSYTVKRLRAEIEPVAARDFMRFLFDWQRVAPDARMEGPDSLDTIVDQLEGFEAAAGSWETEVLPARLGDYEPAWLDDRCLAGHVTWARLRPSNARSNGGDAKVAPVRTTPITLLARRHAALWTSLTAMAEPVPMSSHAQTIADSIRQHGASFFHELVESSGLLRTQVEEGLAELVALGVVSSDSFGGLRALLVPSSERKPFAGERRRRAAKFGMEDSGRWALARRGASASARPEIQAEAIEHVARTLLKRYGVVFWRLLAREAAWLPPWRDLLRVYRRLEGRGEIRGGRFVAGLSGEQFALPEAIGMLREIRRRKESGAWISVSGADPLNLAGILTPGPKLSALTGNRVLYRDGAPVAMFAGGEVEFLEILDPASEWDARKTLLRGAVPTAARDRAAKPAAPNSERHLEQQF